MEKISREQFTKHIEWVYSINNAWGASFRCPDGHLITAYAAPDMKARAAKPYALDLLYETVMKYCGEKNLTLNLK